MKKANGLISKFGSLDLALSIIANDHEERAEIPSQTLTGDKFQ